MSTSHNRRKYNAIADNCAIVMKKKRAANFTAEEKDKLLTTVLTYRDVLFERMTIGSDTPQKSIAWSIIISSVNSVSYVTRTLQDIRRKLKDLKAATRKKYMSVDGKWNESLKVGDASPEELKILALLGNEEALNKINISQEVPVLKEDPLQIPSKIVFDELSAEPNKIEETDELTDITMKIEEETMIEKPSTEDIVLSPNKEISAPKPKQNGSFLTPVSSQNPIKKIKLFMRNIRTPTGELNGVIESSAMVSIAGERPLPQPTTACPLSANVAVQTEESPAVKEAVKQIVSSLKVTALGLESLIAVL